MLTPIPKADQHSAATHNRRLVLRLLRRARRLTRLQLAEQTGLNNSTLSNICRELMQRGIIETAGKRPSRSVGKKQDWLVLRPDFGVAVGVGVEPESVHLMAIDASLGVVAQQHLDYHRGLDELGGWLAAQMPGFLGTHHERLRGVGVAVPGIVDPTRGRVVASTPFRSGPVPLGRQVSEALGLPVCIEHNVAAAALSEAELSPGNGLTDFVYLSANASRCPVSDDHPEGGWRYRGFGSCLWLRGSAYRGHRATAGELDTLLEPDTSLTLDDASFAALAEPDAELHDDAAAMLSHWAKPFATLINLLDPAALVIGGRTPLRNRAALDLLTRTIHGRLIRPAGPGFAVRSAHWADWSTAVGAAIQAMDHALLQAVSNGDATDHAGPFAEHHAMASG